MFFKKKMNESQNENQVGGGVEIEIVVDMEQNIEMLKNIEQK